MKKFIPFLIFILSINIFAQGNAQKVYDTEKAFEKAVAEKGIKQGFLEYLADEGFIFNPSPVNGKESWSSRPDSPAALTWNPVFIDVSANGALAYSTGNGIYRPKGKDDSNAYYSEYATVWQRQPNGDYKVVIDIGISHTKPAVTETDWKSAPPAENSITPKISSTVTAQEFFDSAQGEGVSKAYKNFAAENIRLLREGSMPIIGKKAVLEQLKKDKDVIKYSKRMFFVSAGDLAYLSDTYTLSKDQKITGKGNIVQVWKLRGGVWQIVLDVTTPIPLEQK